MCKKRTRQNTSIGYILEILWSYLIRGSLKNPFLYEHTD